jgi:hypothetical protein
MQHGLDVNCHINNKLLIYLLDAIIPLSDTISSTIARLASGFRAFFQ